MQFSPEQQEKLEMLGTVVIYYSNSKPLGKPVCAAMIHDYDPPTGRASLVTVGQHHYINDVEYDAQLGKPNTWCYKRDIQLQGNLPGNAPEPVEESLDRKVGRRRVIR